jgi:hypothetical protein
MAYAPDAACFDAADTASGKKLTREEINAAFQRVVDYKERLKASGDTAGLADKLRSFAEREAERTRIAAAMQKRHAALNILVRDRLNQTVDSFIRSGLTPKQALLAVMEGTQRGVEGGRVSVAALNLAYEGRYMGGLMAELQANRPHLVDALRDPKMDADIMREMIELRPDGKPGITGNKDAAYVAKVFASYAELARTDLNKLGASIGKLEGWAGAQTHDDVKMIAAGKDAWIASILPKLDVGRTFPDVTTPDEIVEALSGVYDTIITGFGNKVSAREKGQRVNPANLAKSLGKSRVLHFQSAEAALAYRAEFGYGNTVSGIFDHLRHAARTAAAMEVMGPNPDVMLGSLAESLKRKLKEDPKLGDKEKAKRINELNVDAGALRQALDIATGMVGRPVNVTAARIGADVRAVESMAKLGGAVISSLTDTITVSVASQFRGSGFFKGLNQQIGGLFNGRPKGEQAEIAYILGEGFDGLIGHIVAPAAAVDGPVGKLARLQEKFFRFSGLTWWTDVNRATAGRMIAAEMGMRAKSAYGALPANYRHVLGLHGITEAKWDAIRQAQFREGEGRVYVTPDRIRALGDEVIEPLVSTRLAALKPVKTGKTPPPPADHVRFYHGGGRTHADLDVTTLDDLWVTPQLDYAKNYRTVGSEQNAVWYVDIPRSEVDAVGGRDTINDYLINTKLPREWARRARPFIETGSTEVDPAARATIIEDGRRDLELSVLAFIADETNYGMLEVDARTRRTMTLGQRPGTFAGEGIRFMMQFKGFPMAFTQRVGGRALYGHRKDASFLNRSAHIGTLLAGMTVAGYVSMTLKDVMRGYWPPRNPADYKTVMAAFVQGGAAGIYGDFLFGQVNRFGGGILETVAGPTFGAAADAIELGLKTRDALAGKIVGEEAKAPWAEALNLALSNTPFVNMFYTRPVMDFLFLNSLRDAVSPGFMKRQEKRRKTDFGQQTVPFLGDRQVFN